MKRFINVKDVRLLVFQADIQGQDEAIFESFGHVRVTRAVVKYKAANKLRFRCGPVLHFHNLYHV